MEQEKEIEQEQTKKKEQVTLSDTQVFWLRFALWLVFALIIPFTFISIKFNLFETTTSTSIKFGGWGMIAVIILFFTIRTILKYVIKGTTYSMTKQVIEGVLKVVLPLVAIFFVGYILLKTFQEGMNEFLMVMGILIVCETVAIPLNPFPKWLSDHEKKEDQNVIETALEEWDKKRNKKGN